LILLSAENYLTSDTVYQRVGFDTYGAKILEKNKFSFCHFFFRLLMIKNERREENAKQNETTDTYL